MNDGARALALGLLLIGCAAQSAEEVGDVRLGLSAPDTTVRSVEYTVEGGDGYRKVGTFSVAGPGSTFEHTVPGIPVSDATYVVILNATTDDGRRCRSRSEP